MKYNCVVGRRRKHKKNYPQHLHCKSGRYYYVVRLNGKYRWFNLQTSDEQEALRRWAEIESALRQEVGFNVSRIEQQSKDRISFASFAERYLKEITPSKAKKSQSNEKRMMHHVIEQFGNSYVHKITRQDIIRWHDDMRNIPYEANRRLALLRHMLQKALDWGYLTVNPADRIKKHKEKKHKLKLTTHILFNEIYPASEPMLKRAIMLAFHLAQHENEIKNLQWKDFNFDNKTVSFTRRKTDETILIDYSENAALVAFLEHIRANRKELSPYIICHASKQGWKPYSSFKTMWHRALDKAKLYEVDSNGKKHFLYKFKELRHLANTCMKENGITADKRKAVTGHVSIAANEIYTHKTANDTRDAVSVLSKYKPDRF
jgi:integrase